MHFHGPAAAGEATGVDLGIDEFGEDSSVGSTTLTVEQAASLTDGLWYLNIHTAMRTRSGEIRGQVVADAGVLLFDFSHFGESNRKMRSNWVRRRLRAARFVTFDPRALGFSNG